MRKPRFALLFTLLLLTTLALLSGCAPRPGAGEASEQAGESNVLVDLPALVIDYDADGAPSMGGIALSQLGAIIPPAVADQLALDGDLIAQLQSYNIQNLQINNGAGGLDLLVNGLAIPSISWDGESLAALVEVAGAAGEEIPLLDQILPLLTDLGVAAVVRFPAAAGVEEAPLMADSTATADAQAAQDAFLDEVGDPPLINLPISYNEDGTWSMAGISQEEWSALAGQPLDALELSPELIAGLSAAGITQATISTGPDGLQIMINDQALPRLNWGDGRIANLLTILVESGGLSEAGTDPEVLMALLDQLLPIIQTTDLNIHVFFP